MKKIYNENVKVKIEEKIKNHEYLVDEQLPSEQELMTEYGVSRAVIRNVTQKLVDENLIYRKRGIGTFVSKPKIKDPLSAKWGLRQEIKKTGDELYTKECSIERVEILLDAQNTNPVYLIKRLRTINGTPLVLSYTYFCTNIDLLNNRDSIMQSLYEFLDQSGVIIKSFSDEISTCVADADLARALNLPQNSIILKKCREAFNEDGEKIEYSYAYYNPSMYKYKIKLNTEGSVINEI